MIGYVLCHFVLTLCSEGLFYFLEVEGVAGVLDIFFVVEAYLVLSLLVFVEFGGDVLMRGVVVVLDEDVVVLFLETGILYCLFM